MFSPCVSVTALLTLVVLGHVPATPAVQEDPLVVSPPAPPEIRRWVSVAGLNLRRGAGINHSVIRVLAANESVRVLEKAGSWVQVEWDSGTAGPIQGWVYGRFLSDKPLTQTKLQKLKARSRTSDPGADLAALCLVAIPAIYLIWRGLAPKRSGRSVKNGGATITGKAWVVDGDGIEVSGMKIRLARLDAPEIGQTAKDKDGLEIDHGWHARNALIREIGGKQVRVTVKGHDKYGRVLGIVTCNGKDVGAWLVRNGYAIAAYGARYKKEELEARKAKRGMWDYAEKTDPRLHRRRANRGRTYS